MLFFVLSGFLLAQPWVDGPDTAIWAATPCGASPASRPRYWARASLGSLLLLHGTGHGRDIDLHDLPKFLLFVANVFPETRNQLDPPMWSLHIEVSLLRRAAADRAGAAAGQAAAARVRGADRRRASRGRRRARSKPGRPRRRGRCRPTSARSRAGIAAAVLARRAPPRAAWVAARDVSLVRGQRRRGTAAATGLARPRGGRPAGGASASRAIVWALVGPARPACSRSAPLRALGTVSFGVYLWHMPVLYALQLHERFPERFVPAIALGPAAHVRARDR